MPLKRAQKHLAVRFSAGTQKIDLRKVFVDRKKVILRQEASSRRERQWG